MTDDELGLVSVVNMCFLCIVKSTIHKEYCFIHAFAVHENRTQRLCTDSGTRTRGLA